MEATIVNLVEPGDRIIVGVNGIFGERLCAMVHRCGGVPLRVEAPWGHPIPLEHIEQCLKTSLPIKAVALVHAETSTGVRQPIEEFGILCHRFGALSIIDAVTSLAGIPVKVDEWEIDACYAATQKCLSCPPGVAPLTLSPKALEVIHGRKSPCQSWYLDCALVADYWEEHKRTYHHTAPISMIYALHESLCLIQEEGLESRFTRHGFHSQALRAGLETLGFALFPMAEYALPTLNCLRLPDYLADQPARAQLLQEFHIEVGGGLGALAGKVWRIGLMGESCQKRHVMALLEGIETLCSRVQGGLGHQAQGAGQSAAEAIYAHNILP